MWPDSLLRYHFYKKLCDPIAEIRNAEINIRASYNFLRDGKIYYRLMIIDVMRQCDRIRKALEELKKEKL